MVANIKIEHLKRLSLNLILLLTAVLVALSAFGQNAADNRALDSSNYHDLSTGLDNSYRQFEKHKKGRIAFLGGSITYNGGWRDSLMAYFQARFPQTEFDFIAAGIPSMGSTPSAYRLQRDVLSKGSIDLLFLEAAVNDATNERSDLEQIRGMEGIIRNLRRSNTSSDIVIMYFVDPDKMNVYRQGQEPRVISNHNQVARHYGIPTINLAREVTDRIDNQEFSWEQDFKDLHPSPFGQGIYAHSMIQFLQQAYSTRAKVNQEVLPHPVPQKLEPWCYDNGRLLDIGTAEIKNRWVINSNWEPDDGSGTRDNYIAVPMLVSSTPGAALSLAFEGNAVGIVVASGYDAGIVEYRIDQGDWQKQNLFTRWSSLLHLPWFYTLAAGLPNQPHQLELRISQHRDPESDGNACRIRYFFVNGY